MPYAPAKGARIFYEETGSGTPILFIHEFGGDHRSWTDQMRHFGRGWRAVTWAARGYPPSDCPEDESLYGQEAFEADAVAVLDAAGIDKAHIVGLSMGGYTALRLAIAHPGRVLSCVAAGAGSGSERATRDGFIAECRAAAAACETAGRLDADGIGIGPTRIQLANKDPIGWRAFVAHLAEHPGFAAARTLRRVQASRPSLYDFEAELARVAAPVLLLIGDEDEPCLDVNVWMKRLMPTARLGVLPGSGHGINLEEPAFFNDLVERFIVEVERGTWKPRDARAKPGGVLTSLAAPAAKS